MSNRQQAKAIIYANYEDPATWMSVWDQMEIERLRNQESVLRKAIDLLVIYDCRDAVQGDAYRYLRNAISNAQEALWAIEDQREALEGVN